MDVKIKAMGDSKLDDRPVINKNNDKKKNTFAVFQSSLRKTTGSLEEQENVSLLRHSYWYFHSNISMLLQCSFIDKYSLQSTFKF